LETNLNRTDNGLTATNLLAKIGDGCPAKIKKSAAVACRQNARGDESFVALIVSITI
jgi:hypothetical protein